PQVVPAVGPGQNVGTAGGVEAVLHDQQVLRRVPGGVEQIEDETPLTGSPRRVLPQVEAGDDGEQTEGGQLHVELRAAARRQPGVDDLCVHRRPRRYQLAVDHLVELPLAEEATHLVGQD